MLGYRSLKHPQSPDPQSPDYYEQYQRYQEENRVWWQNWEHNFNLSLALVLAVFLALLAVGAVLSIAG